MSDAIRGLRDYLAKSPSVVYPEDVLAYLPAIEADNARLRELVRQMHPRAKAFLQMGVQLGCIDTLSYDWELQMYELGIEVS